MTPGRAPVMMASAMADRSGVVNCVVAVAILFAVRTAGAQTPAQDAKEHYRKGTAAYNLGKYAEAAEEYELSYRASLDPALLFNVAQAYRLAGDQKKALTTYKSYLRSAPNGDRRDVAQAKVREIEAALNYDDPFARGAKPSMGRPAPPPEPVHQPSEPMVEPQPKAPAVSVTLTKPEATEPSAAVPLYRRWPFWAIVGTVAVGGIVAVVVASSSSANAPTTSYGTMRF